MMTKSKYEMELISVLTDMAKNGIRTLEDLQKAENAHTYTALWFALENFVNHVALQTKNRKTNENVYIDGNAPHLRELLEMGCDLEDLRGNVLVRIVQKMTLVLDRPVEAQIPYCVTICSNCLVNEYRKRCPNGMQPVSLNETIGNQDEDDFTRMDKLAATTGTEDWIMAQATVDERIAEMLEDLRQLRSTDQKLVYLCSYDRMRPRDIYHAVEQLSALGRDPQQISDILFQQIGRRYYIPRTEMALQMNKPLSSSMVKHLSTLDRQTITNKISDVKLTLPASVKQRLKARQHSAES